MITMVLSFRNASEVFSPLRPQARLPSLVRVPGEKKGNQGQRAQLCTPLHQRRGDIGPSGDHTRVAVLDMTTQSV